MYKRKEMRVNRAKYQKPMIEKIQFEYTDVIATSVICLDDCPVVHKNNLSIENYSESR